MDPYKFRGQGTRMHRVSLKSNKASVETIARCRRGGTTFRRVDVSFLRDNSFGSWWRKNSGSKTVEGREGGRKTMEGDQKRLREAKRKLRGHPWLLTVRKPFFLLTSSPKDGATFREEKNERDTLNFSKHFIVFYLY